MNQNSAFDASIPVLTEVFADQAEQVLAAPAPAAAAAAPAPSAPAALQNGDWDELERKLCERILHQLQGRIDFVLEARLRDSINEVLKTALGSLTEDIRVGLQETLEKTVARAITQEIAHLKAQKK